MNNIVRKNILELGHKEVRKFFLKHESYCNFDIPQYFSFSELLEKMSEKLSSDSDIYERNRKEMGKAYDVNYLLYANKDGNLSWRPLQLINPLAYVDLVHLITENEHWGKLQDRFKKFQKNENIKCLSIPIESNNRQSDKAHQILNWWEEVEQQSILLSLEYGYIFETDIADCYGSIYTHSIAWAVEDKDKAKDGRSNFKLTGNAIDKRIQNMQNQQTNGIPQGSILMDFIAEIVLGYIDMILSSKLEELGKLEEYKILRYRDDYRIFVHNSSDGKKILRVLSEIMMPFGLKLNASKTRWSQDIITQSIKKDKLGWLSIPQNKKVGLQKQLMLIRQHSINYPNSGSLNVALNKFDMRLEMIIRRIKEKGGNIRNIKQMISIATDIAYNNPKSISICCAIISKLLAELTKDENTTKISHLVYNKLSSMSNSGFAQIWLQRMLKSKLSDFSFSEKICGLLECRNEKTSPLWNIDWIVSEDEDIKNIITTTPIFLPGEFSELGTVIANKEVDLFNY